MTCLALSPDGKMIFSGSKDAGLVVWNLETGEKLARFPGGRKDTEKTHLGHCTAVNAIAVSADKQFLVRISSLDSLRHLFLSNLHHWDLCSPWMPSPYFAPSLVVVNCWQLKIS